MSNSTVLELVADVCQAPMVALKVAGDTSAHFAAALGLPVAAVDVPRSMSLCGMVSASDDVMVVDDAEHDPRLAMHPLVAGVAHVRFLAAAPLHHEGHIAGAHCVFDTAPRRIDTETTLRHLLSRRPVDDLEPGQLGSAFSRARRAETPGLGPGLAITHRILAALGARLSVRSATGAGVIARLTFGDVRVP